MDSLKDLPNYCSPMAYPKVSDSPGGFDVTRLERSTLLPRRFRTTMEGDDGPGRKRDAATRVSPTPTLSPTLFSLKARPLRPCRPVPRRCSGAPNAASPGHLAVSYLEEGRAAEVRELADEMVTVCSVTWMSPASPWRLFFFFRKLPDARWRPPISPGRLPIHSSGPEEARRLCHRTSLPSGWL